MAERRFLTVTFDPSYTDESGGEPRRLVSSYINTEDYKNGTNKRAGGVVDPLPDVRGSSPSKAADYGEKQHRV